MLNIKKLILNTYSEYSLSTYFRRKRIKALKYMIDKMPKPIKILDLGGRESFWKNIYTYDKKGFHVTILNIASEETTLPNFVSVKGNALNMSKIKKNQFDLVFSNSVIEHVGNFSNQQKFAKEVMRVGKFFFIQTPYKFFFIEPHFLFPFFQFFSIKTKIWLLTHFSLGNHKRYFQKSTARQTATQINLLSIKQMRFLFPKAKILRERILGLTKSITSLSSNI